MSFEHVRFWKQEYESSGWWHSFELPDGTIIEGSCALSGLKQRLANFPIPRFLSGKRVLDIGTWDGWYAFELARRGAAVVAVDCWDNPRFHEMRRTLGLEDRVEYRQMDVYDITPETVGRFDIVMFLGVLYHLKHPLLALERVCSVTTELACVDSFVLREQTESQHNSHEFGGRLVMEFFETDEFGGQTDNWVAPTTSCLAALCRTAGFARVEPVGSLQYSASFACHRRWITPDPDWGLEPRLLDAVHHTNFGTTFSSRRDEYVLIWFSVNSGHLGLDDVFPEVSGFGVRPIQVGYQAPNWFAIFKLPPGLQPGWHDVQVRVRGSRLSTPLRIGVDLPLWTKGIRITTAADSSTWKPDEIDLSIGNILALWMEGLPESVDRHHLQVTLNGTPAEITYLEPPAPDKPRQVNVAVPADTASEALVEVAVGTKCARYRVRCFGIATSSTN